MPRGCSPTETMARAFVALRVATDDPVAMHAAIDEASAELRAALAQRSTYSKTEATHLLRVSAPTLDTWIERGMLPVVRVPRYKRDRIPAGPLLILAAEIQALRRQGRKRGLLAEALSRLEQEDPAWRAEFDACYRPDEIGTDRERYVSAAPGPALAPDD